MFGRVTYEMMAAYWPTPQAEQDEPRVSERMNRLPKIVVSGSLDKADWAGTEIISDLAGLARVKDAPDGAIIVLGSAELTVNLIRAGLLDEVRIMVNPVLGAGRSPFRTADERIKLTLLGARPFASGNVLLTYKPAGR